MRADLVFTPEDNGTDVVPTLGRGDLRQQQHGYDQPKPQKVSSKPLHPYTTENGQIEAAVRHSS